MTEIYPAHRYEPRKAISYLVNRVRMKILNALDSELASDERLANTPVTAAQFVILVTLSMGEVASASELCKELQYDAGAMTRMLDRLENMALLRRVRNTQDRRQVNLELSTKGLAAIPGMRKASFKVLNRFLTGFSTAEVQQMETLLTRMLSNGIGSRNQSHKTPSG